MRKLGGRGLDKRAALALTIAALAAPALASIFAAQARASQVARSLATDAEFDVASIKLSHSERPILSVEELLWRKERVRGGRVRMPAVPLRVLIQRAYDVKSFQIQGGPPWMSSARYDVEAIASGVATNDEIRPMLRTLLADRFKLMLRREKRTLPVFELVAAKGGLKIASMKDGGCVTLGPDSPPPPLSPPPAPMPNICGWLRRVILSPAPALVERIEAAGVSMLDLIGALSGDVDRNIVDRTGFKDKFSFRLDFASGLSPSNFPGAPSGRDPEGRLGIQSSEPSMFGAVKEQLGLELKSSKGPVDVLVVSHVERPSEN